jgi:hypothetical protein
MAIGYKTGAYEGSSNESQNQSSQKYRETVPLKYFNNGVLMQHRQFHVTTPSRTSYLMTTTSGRGHAVHAHTMLRTV